MNALYALFSVLFDSPNSEFIHLLVSAALAVFGGVVTLLSGICLFIYRRTAARGEAMAADLEKLKTENFERREAIAVLRERIAALEGWRAALGIRGSD